MSAIGISHPAASRQKVLSTTPVDAHAVRGQVLQQLWIVDADGLEPRRAPSRRRRPSGPPAPASPAAAAAVACCLVRLLRFGLLRRLRIAAASLMRPWIDVFPIAASSTLFCRDRRLEVAVRDAGRPQVRAEQLLDQQDGPQPEDEVAERKPELLLLAVHHSQTKAQFRTPSPRGRLLPPHRPRHCRVTGPQRTRRPRAQNVARIVKETIPGSCCSND